MPNQQKSLARTKSTSSNGSDSGLAMTLEIEFQQYINIKPPLLDMNFDNSATILRWEPLRDINIIGLPMSLR